MEGAKGATMTDPVSRAKWGGELEFLMSCIAASVGLGNVWRFPYTAYENGGGAFLIPYIIVLFVIGKPFYYLEAAIGQFSSNACVKIWSVSPAMKGIGYGQVIAATCILTYYCSLMALILFYLVASFQSELPWSACRSEWGTGCFDAAGTSNTTVVDTNVTRLSSAELYFRKVVLNELDSIDDGIGLPSWKLTIALAVSWLCVFVVLVRGVKSAGKFSYFLAIFPYIVLIALLVRAVTLPGAWNGILFFITPKWSKLWEPSVWYAAMTQCFFSLNVCFGSIIMYSSYNKFDHKVYRDVMVVTTLDTFTSLIAGSTIFGILGNLAYESGTDDISSVVRGGSGLAFISYPEALSRFTFYPQFFAVIFFVMMFVLGVGSAVGLAGTSFSALCDAFPKVPQWHIISGVTVVGFLVGLVYVTPGGQWILTLVDYYGGTFVAIIVGVAEVCTIFWIYGLRRFLDDLEFMTGRRAGLYWRLCWLIITPGLMMIILVYTFVTYDAPTYNGSSYPTAAYAAGWTLLGIAVAQLLANIVYVLITNRSSSIVLTFKRAFQPSAKWGPRETKNRGEWYEFLETKRQQGTSRSLKATFFK